MGGRRLVAAIVLVGAVLAGNVAVAGAQVPPPLLVSVGRNGRSANADSSAPAVSRDGRFVVFVSLASDVVTRDRNGASDVFVRDLTTGATTLVSASRSGAPGDGASDEPSISASGRFVAFRSAASNLVRHDTNDVADVFVRDLVKGTTTRVSVSNDGTQADFESSDPYISGDGRVVAFSSYATNLVPGSQGADAYTRDLQTGHTDDVGTGVGESDCSPLWFRGVSALSGDGTHVAIVVNCADQENLYDRVVATDATQLVDSTDTGVGSGGSLTSVRYGTNGSKVAWTLATRDATAIKLLDLATGVRHEIAPRRTGVFSGGLALSGDGRRVVYVGGDGVDPGLGFPTGQQNVYSYDLRTHAFHYVSVPLEGPSAEPNGPCGAPALSADGRVAAFVCDASDIVRGDRNDASDVFVRTVVSAPPPDL